MVELFQMPWSPYCFVQKRILEFGGVTHRAVNIPSTDRSVIWRISKERYYQVPLLRHGRSILFETSNDSQVLAKYLDLKFELDLFPTELEGVQSILWRHIEQVVEDYTFRLNDAYFREFVSKGEWCAYLRHKERKFGAGCTEQWLAQRKELIKGLVQCLLPYEQMLVSQPYLLGARPHFVDFDLWGMLANFLFSGRYRFPSVHRRLKDWYTRMSKLKISKLSREKLHSGHERPVARPSRAAGIRR